MRIIGRRPPKMFSSAHLLAGLLMLLLPMAAFYQSFWLAEHKHLFVPLLFRVQSERIDCPYCHGLGTRPMGGSTTNRVICPICFGVGGHYVRRLPGQHEVLCTGCAGMGRVFDLDLGMARFCRRCGGRGLIEVLDDVEPPEDGETASTETPDRVAEQP